MSEENIKEEAQTSEREIIVKEEKYEIEPKKVLLLNYDGSYPLTDEELTRLLGDMEQIVNETEDDFVNRILLLPKGFSIEQLSEHHFVNVWASDADDETIETVIEILESEIESSDDEEE